MHRYLIFVEMFSTSIYYGEAGIEPTSKKLRVACGVYANNSHLACVEASKKLDVPYDKLSALLVKKKGKEFYLESSIPGKPYLRMRQSV